MSTPRPWFYWKCRIVRSLDRTKSGELRQYGYIVAVRPNNEDTLPRLGKALGELGMSTTVYWSMADAVTRMKQANSKFSGMYPFGVYRASVEIVEQEA